MSIFGGGSDLAIFDDCNKNSNSWSNLGHSYEKPRPYHSYEYGSTITRSYLAGSIDFTVLEIEVF